MSSYRFCRSDDAPLLVEAYNRCYRPHFSALPALTLEEFKRRARELALWTSSCMVASEGSELIAVLLAAKTETENLIYRVGVRPGYERQGHGRHLLESLSQKMAILGPSRLLAEVPAEWSGARRFLEACGYREEARFTDFELAPAREKPTVSPLVVSLSFEELADAVGSVAEPCAWHRRGPILQARKAQLSALALVSDVKLEAALVYDGDAERRVCELLVLHAADAARTAPMLTLLLRTLAAQESRPLRLSRAAGEIDFDFLLRLGFVRGGKTAVYSAQAEPV